VVQDLAAEADVISDRDRRRLAVHATDRAHSLRRRRRNAAVACVALVTALAVGIPYGVRSLDFGRDAQPAAQAELPPGVDPAPGVPTHVIDATDAPIELLENWYVVGNRLVLNRTTGTYETFRASSVLPSPNGRWVATNSASLSGGVSGPGVFRVSYRVYDLATGGSRLYDTGILGAAYPAEWSPDGDTLLIGDYWEHVSSMIGDQYHDGSTPVIAATFIDVATGTIVQRPIDVSGLECSPCQVVWMPTGDEVGVLLAREDASGRRTVTGIAVFGLDGQVRRTLPVPGIPAGVGAWSRDRQLVIVHGAGEDGTREAQLVHVPTGRILRSMPDLALMQAQWIGDGRYLTWEPVIPPSESPATARGLASLWDRDSGELLERWVLPIEVVQFPPALAPLVVKVT
jgi:hypothetical protein